MSGSLAYLAVAHLNVLKLPQLLDLNHHKNQDLKDLKNVKDLKDLLDHQDPLAHPDHEDHIMDRLVTKDQSALKAKKATKVKEAHLDPLDIREIQVIMDRLVFQGHLALKDL